MLTCKIEWKPKISAKELEIMHLADVLEDDREFSVLIDEKVFFSELYFPMWELAQYCQKWLKELPKTKWWENPKKEKGHKKPKEDFIYDTIESQDNPLLAFFKTADGWKVFSVWQKFKCDKIFTDDEVKNFIKEIISRVVY